MAVRRTIACIVAMLTLLIDITQAENISDWKDVSEIRTISVVAVLCVSLLVVVFIITLCGGCTPMEVGSDDHAAAGGRKSYSQYSSVATDVNTQVMSAGTTLPNDPYQPQTQALPYPLHPETAQTFTGYQSQGQQPVGAVSQGYNAQSGYQAAGAQGYNAHPGHQPAGANRHFSESEPPPPNYYEAMQSGTPVRGQGQTGTQASAPAQQYGW